MKLHDIGDLVHVFTERPFSDALTDAPLDPDTVNLSIRKPDGDITTYTYGVSTIVKDSVGTYSADISVDQAGDWYYRWWSEGSGQAADEQRFRVRVARAIE